jgi:hypothetical protein
MLDNGSICLISVDGTDCPIQEDPFPFSSRWYCHKFKGSGLRYEIGVCIQTGWIVWKTGRTHVGHSVTAEFPKRLIHALDPCEMFIADRGYSDSWEFAMTPTCWRNPFESMNARVRARHETVNRRIKIFNILSRVFRNDKEKHWMAFHAIVNMLQIEIEQTRPNQQVFYDDKLYL